MFRLEDKFDHPGRNWQRGSVYVAEKTGQVVLHPGSDSHVTLAGTTMHPDCLQEFSAKLTWAFEGEEGGQFVVALAKPYEWSPIRDAVLQLRVEQSGRLTVMAKNETLLYEQRLDVSPNMTVRFGRQGDHLMLGDGAKRVNVPWPQQGGDKGGFLAVQTLGSQVALLSFDISSPCDTPAFSEEEHLQNVDAWLEWQMQQSHAALNQLCALASSERDAGRWGYRHDLNVAPGLVRIGEPVTIEFQSDAPREDCPPTMEPDYLGTGPSAAQNLALEWERQPDGTYAASTLIVPQRAGQWRVSWDTAEGMLSRVFAVIDDNYAVCTLWVGSNKPELDAEIHRYDLPGDYWVGDWWTPFYGDPDDVLEYLRFYAQLRHRYGDRLVPFANANWLVPDIPDFNLMNLSAHVQREALEMVCALWKALGIGPLEVLASYTFGHETPQVAQELGIKAISSLCTWQNWLDGSDGNHWKINHWGAPNAPYYVGQDDFRQVAPGKSIVAFSMGTASSVRNYSIFTMEGCPSLTCPMQRYKGTIAQSQNMTRFYDAVDGWLSDTQVQTEPLFFTVGLENFVGSPDWTKANDLAVGYLVDRAQTQKLVFASAADIADYYQAHYSEQPETCYYQPDIYCGYRANAKPAVIPDRIEVSNQHLHTLHCRGEALPQFFWDFGRVWNDPEWLEQPELRNEFGLIPPEQVQADTCIPRMVNTEGVRVQTRTDVQADQVTIRIDITSDADYDYLPIGIWDIPLEITTAHVAGTSDETRFIRAADSVSGNLHGVAICGNIRTGQTSRRISLVGTFRAPKHTDVTISDHTVGRTITRDGTAHTYLWRKSGVPAGKLRVDVPTGRTAQVRYNNGDVALPDKAGILDIWFGDDWAHEVPLVIGLSAHELQNCAAFAPQ